MTMESHILMLTLLSVKMENLGPYAMKKTEASAETYDDSCHPQCPNGGSGPFSGHGRELQGATQDYGHSPEHYLT